MSHAIRPAVRASNPVPGCWAGDSCGLPLGRLPSGHGHACHALDLRAAVVVAASDPGPAAEGPSPKPGAVALRGRSDRRRLGRVHHRAIRPGGGPTGSSALGLVLCAALLLMAGCGVVRGSVSTVRALDDAGFGIPDVQLEPGDSLRVTVEKDTEDLDAAAADAAAVVWHNLPFRIEHLEVTCNNGYGGRGTYQADRAEMEGRFGARDPALDKGVQASDTRTILVVVAVLIGGGLLVLVSIVILIVVLIRRSRRRNRPPGPPGPPGPPPAWVTQPPPPGYGPPA